MARGWIVVWSRCLLLLACFLGAPSGTPADDPPAAPARAPVDAERQQRLAERDRFDTAWRQHLAAGQWKEAIAAALDMLAIERQVLGDEHADTDGSRTILAELYAFSGEGVAALRYAEESLALQKKLHGDDHWRTADAQDRLRLVKRVAELGEVARAAAAEAMARRQQALVANRQGKSSQAIELGQQALEALEKQLGAPFVVAAAASYDLGQAYFSSQKYAEAVAAFRKSAEIYEKATGAFTPPRASSLQASGVALRDEKKFDEAIAAYRQAAEIFAKLYPADHADTRSNLTGLWIVLDRSASALEEQDQLGEAHTQRQESLELKRKLYAADAWQIVDGQLYLARNERLAAITPEARQKLLEAREKQLAASANYRQDKTQDALPLCQAAFDTRRELLGEEQIDTAISVNLLGLIHNDLKDYARGEECLRQSAAIWKKIAGPDFPEVATPLQNLADSCEQQAKLAEAKELTLEAYRIRLKAYGQPDEDTRRSLTTLVRLVNKIGAALEGENQMAAAEASRQELIELSAKLYGEQDWRTTDARISLSTLKLWAKLNEQQRTELSQATQTLAQAESRNNENKYKEAEPLALKAVATREAVLGPDAPATSYARQVLIAAYRGQSKYADAEKVAEQLVQSNEKAYGTNHPRYAMALEMLGHVFYNQDKYQPANERYQKALAVRRQAQGDRDGDTINTAVFLANSQANLAAQFEQKEEYAAAIAARQQALQLQQFARGADHYLTGDARYNWEMAKQLAGLNLEQRANLQLALRKIIDANRLNQEKKFNAAVEASEDAVRLRKEVLGDKHRLVAIAVFRLGVHVNNRGDAAEALKIIVGNDELLKNSLGANNPDYAYTQTYLAGIYKAQNDLARAIPRLRSAFEAYAQSYGDKNEDTIKVVDELVAALQQTAAAQLAKSDTANAKKAWEEIVALTKRRYGDKSSQAIDARWGMYRVELWPSLKANQRKELIDSDKWMAIAEQKMKEVRSQDRGENQRTMARAAAEPAGYAVQLRQQVLGDNPDTADALMLLAEAQTIAQQAGAVGNYQKALAMRRKTLGETHPAIAKTQEALMQSVAASAPRPFKWASNLTPAQQKRLEERDRLEALADQQNRAGQYDAEYRTLEQMLRIELEVYGGAHVEIENTYKKLARRAERAGNGQLYRSNWVKLGEVRKKLYGADSWQAVEAQVTVANYDLPRRLNQQQSQLLNAAWGYHNKLREDGVSFKAPPDQLQPALNATETLRKALLSVVGENHLYYADCLEGQAAVYYMMQNQEESDALRRKAAEIVGRVLTTKHPMYVSRMNGLATDYRQQAHFLESKGEFDRAYEVWRKRVDLLTTLHGAGHWQVTNARLAGVHSQKLSKLSPEIRAKVVANQSTSQFDRPPQMVGAPPPEFDETLAGRVKLAQFMEKQLGDDDLTTIDILFAAAKQAQAENRISLAVELAQRSLELRRRVQGADHPATARNANFLGLLWYLQADYAKAEPLLREAEQIMKRLGYTNYSVYAAYLNNLAMVYEATGDFDRAEPLLRTAINVKPVGDDAQQDFAGEDSFETFVDDNEVLMGQFNLAEALDDNVRGIDPDLEFMAIPPHLGQYVNNMALLAMARGDFPQAEVLLRQSLDLIAHDSGQSSVEYLNGLTNLATACERQGDLEQAELLTEYVVQEYRRLSGYRSKYAIALNNLGVICLERGDAARSEKLRREALAVQREVIGERHPTTTLTRANLALLTDRAGKSAEAASELDAVLEIASGNLQLAAAVQSERQQLRTSAAMRGYLDQYLSVTDRAGFSPEATYRHVLGWKGVVSTRQRQMRALRASAQKGADPALAKMYQELTQVNQQLASLSFGGEAKNEQRQGEEAKGAAFAKLSLRKDELERDLAAKNELFDRQRKIQRLAPADIKKLLPANGALVDLVEYEHTTYPSEGSNKIAKERRLAAFVVRPDADIVRVELGPAAPVEKLVDACRESWLNGRTADHDPAAELRKVLWQPIADHLNGAETVLVSPDGAASRVPFAALPGSKPDTYLIEELTVAILPVPQLLGELVAGGAPATSAATEGELLLMGDVDFDAEPGKLHARTPSAARDGSMSKFGPLPGTLAEVQAVSKLFSASHKQPPKVLEKAAATEDAFRQQAAGVAYLHLATHGFFAPPTVKRGDVPRNDFLTADSDAEQSFDGWNPGLLSGIVLAGVNRPLDGSRDDGILTAAEVADLNLSQAQLVVLSACETGLGQIAGGEGALGLQRAFQVAGARSVISSLWKVDDAATQLLMTLFYENLWSKKLPPLAAFREAQLSLLNGKVDTSKLRGLDVAVNRKLPEKQDARLSPRLWAAFVVSGGL